MIRFLFNDNNEVFRHALSEFVKYLPSFSILCYTEDLTRKNKFEKGHDYKNKEHFNYKNGFVNYSQNYNNVREYFCLCNFKFARRRAKFYIVPCKFMKLVNRKRSIQT